MGLDCYWIMPEGKKHPIFSPDLQLCGGLLSGNGMESFRGKVYHDFVFAVSGIGLYNNLSNEEVKQIADSLQNKELCLLHIDELWHEERNEKIIEDLRKMFSAYAHLGATLKAWW